MDQMHFLKIQNLQIGEIVLETLLNVQTVMKGRIKGQYMHCRVVLVSVIYFEARAVGIQHRDRGIGVKREEHVVVAIKGPVRKLAWVPMGS
jgi:hypothetical protein